MDILEGASIVPRTTSVDPAQPTIALGVGDSAGLNGNSLCLTQKGQLGVNAVVDFICQRSDAEIGNWKSALGLGQAGAPLFRGATIQIEDASPDTCISIVALARRLQGKTLPDAWRVAAGRWELGEVDHGGTQVGWGTLHTALVHAEMGTGGNSEDLARAFSRGVAYVQELLTQNDILPIDPMAMPTGFSPAAPELEKMHRLALLRLSEEALSYRCIRDAAIRVQLHIPTPMGGRRSLVDAIFLVQVQFESALKTFIRRDTESWSGRGYAFMGLFRPALAGTGNDITFSLDPAAGLWLEPLWAELERQEDAAWGATGEVRPRNQPRGSMASFSKPRADGLTASNQPWWDDSGRYMLVGAPCNVAPGKAGTRLGWADSLAIVWRLFAPGHDLEVKDRNTPGATQKLIIEDAGALRELLIVGGNKHIVDVVRVNAGDEMLIWCPTFEQALAAIADQGRADLVTLPEPESFDLFRSAHGLAVVTHHGVLLLSTDSSGLFPAIEMRNAATRVANTHAVADRLAAKMEAARALTVEAISCSDVGKRHKALRALYAIEVQARENWPTAISDGPPLLVRFAEACEARWSAVERFKSLIAEANELESMITSSSEAKTAALIERVTLYGFPLALFSNLLGVVFAPWGAVDSSGKVPMSAYNIAFGALLWFLGLSVAVMLILAIIRRRQAAQWVISDKDRIS